MKFSLLKSKISLFLCLLFLFLFLTLGYSQGEEIAKFPNRPITYIMSFPAGVTTDLAVRLIAKEAEKFLGKSIAVINKSGGGGAIGAAAIATAKPDGYTVGHLGFSSLFILPHLENVPYDALKDFEK